MAVEISMSLNIATNSLKGLRLGTCTLQFTNSVDLISSKFNMGSYDIKYLFYIFVKLLNIFSGSCAVSDLSLWSDNYAIVLY